MSQKTEQSLDKSPPPMVWYVNTSPSGDPTPLFAKSLPQQVERVETFTKEGTAYRIATMFGLCERCGEELSGKQQRWCSPKCSKLGLKSLYKKRNRPKINAYNREYNSRGPRLRKNTKYLKSECQRCSSRDNLQVCHVKPRWAGGQYDSVITLCQGCHYEFDNTLRGFWL